MQKLLDLSLASLTLSIFVTACAPPVQSRLQSESIDLKLSAYLTEFQSQALSRGVSLDASHLSMSFNETMPPSTIPGATTLAYCQRDPILGPSVVVKGSYFNGASAARRETIVFHELGHCLLNLEHINTTEVSYWYKTNSPAAAYEPSSIMNELQFDPALYSGNRATYLDRLFNVSTSAPLYYNAPSQLAPNFYN